MATKQKSTAPRARRSRGEGLSPEWKRTLALDERRREAIEAWRAKRAAWRSAARIGKEPPDPWDQTNWVALGCCPRARTLFRTMAATSGVANLEDFRDLLRCAAMAAGQLDNRTSEVGRGLFTEFKETLLVLSNAVEVDPAPLEDEEDAYQPPPARREGINTKLLESSTLSHGRLWRQHRPNGSRSMPRGPESVSRTSGQASR